MAEWIDLIDPTPEELREKLPRELYETALDRLLTPAEHTDEPRPTLQGHGGYIFGIFLVAVAVPDPRRHPACRRLRRRGGGGGGSVPPRRRGGLQQRLRQASPCVRRSRAL